MEDTLGRMRERDPTGSQDGAQSRKDGHRAVRQQGRGLKPETGEPQGWRQGVVFTGFPVTTAHLPCSVTNLSFHGSLAKKKKMSGRAEGAAGRRRTHQAPRGRRSSSPRCPADGRHAKGPVLVAARWDRRWATRVPQSRDWGENPGKLLNFPMLLLEPRTNRHRRQAGPLDRFESGFCLAAF